MQPAGKHVQEIGKEGTVKPPKYREDGTKVTRPEKLLWKAQRLAEKIQRLEHRRDVVMADPDFPLPDFGSKYL